MILNVEIKNRVAVYKPSGEKPVCGNSGDTVKFAFDEEWAAHDKKTARFIWNKKYFDVEFTGDTCEIPVITGASAFMVGVYVGEQAKGETLLSSTHATIPIELSVRCATNAPNAGTGENYTNEAKGYAMQAQEAMANIEQYKGLEEIVQFDYTSRWAGEDHILFEADEFLLLKNARFVELHCLPRGSGSGGYGYQNFVFPLQVYDCTSNYVYPEHEACLYKFSNEDTRYELKILQTVQNHLYSGDVPATMTFYK